MRSYSSTHIYNTSANTLTFQGFKVAGNNEAAVHAGRRVGLPVLTAGEGLQMMFIDRFCTVESPLSLICIYWNACKSNGIKGFLLLNRPAKGGY